MSGLCRVLAGGVVLATLGLWSGCSASEGDGIAGQAGKDGGATGGAGGGGGIGNTGGINSDATSGGGSGGASCAEFVDVAKQAPLAMLIVLDVSKSMAEAGKWTAAQLAIVQAIDSASFDNISLGLTVYPSGDIPGPACIGGFPVGCGVSALPQVPIADTGSAKSNTAGVRQQIYFWLSSNQPNGSATPGYDALKAAISGLSIYSLPPGGIRSILLISDGAFTCASLSNPQRPAYPDSIGCLDWENPGNVVAMLDGALKDPTAPIRTFVIGVPGSNTKPGDFEAPPYYMRRALSSFALAGSPDLVPAGCDGFYDQNQGDPALSCHYDLSQGTFNASVLAKAISDIRGQVLGCVYQLPDPGAGKTIDKNKVNVIVTLNGQATTIPKRSDPNDQCLTSPCWDYDANGQVVLIGQACDQIKTSTDAKIEIQVGCATIVK